MFFSAAFLIPYPAVPERYYNLFYFNAPSWSLFWEYVANIGYALLLYKIRNRTLWLFTVLAAGLLIYTAYKYRMLGVGWGLSNYLGGAPRVAFSFLMGLLVYRSNWIIRSSLGFAAVSMLLVAAFVFPFVKVLNPITEPLIVIFYLPFLVSLGAGAQLTNRSHKACVFLGELSYPLYMVHYPFLWVFLSYLETHKPPMSQLQLLIPVLFVSLVGFAYLIMVYVDRPIRRYLKAKLVSSK